MPQNLAYSSARGPRSCGVEPRRRACSRLAWSAVCVLAAALPACAPSTGECDQDAALEVVYNPEGTPAFAGQALVIRSCAGGGACHAEGNEPVDRNGAPAELNFDLSIASTTNDVALDSAERLRRHQERMLHMRGEVWRVVHEQIMPPGGEAGREYWRDVDRMGALTYQRVASDGELVELPGLETSEGREIFRNWLACRTPVIERTVERRDREDNVTGFTVPGCEQTCVEIGWSPILEEIIAPTCTGSACHDAEAPAGNLDLTGTAAQVYDRLVGTAADGAQCRPTGLPRVQPNEPEGSLLYLKLTAQSFDDSPCGSPMPLSGTPLGEQRLCVIRAWIECGACGSADDTCDACYESMRSACNLPDMPAGPGECSAEVACTGTI